MKTNLHWQIVIAVICIGLVAMLLSYQVQTAGLCSSQIPSTGGRLIEGYIGRPLRLNPLFVDGNLVDEQLANLIFDGLTKYGPDGYLAPVLAESWSVSEDGKTYTFNLRDDVVWHDGQPFTAADVVFTYKLLQNDSLPVANSLRDFWKTVKIEELDDSRVSFSLPEPYSPFLDATTRGILPAHLLSEVPVNLIADHEFNRQPIGTGPYMVNPGNDWQQDGYLLLSQAPGHWRGGTMLDALEIRFFPDSESLIKAYRSGEIQAIVDVPPDGLDQIGALDGMRFFTSPSDSYTEILFNFASSGTEALKSRGVRQAFAYALDRDALIDRGLSGQGIQFDGPYLPDSWAYNPSLVTAYSYQPAQSNSLLEEAGWTLVDGSPIRQKDSSPLVVRLLLANDPLQLEVAELIAEQWEQVGIGSEIIQADRQSLEELLTEGEFDVALLEITPIGDPDLYDFWSQEAILVGQNYGSWNNRRASEALETARKLSTTEERKPYYDSFIKQFDADLPAITLSQSLSTYGIVEEVREVEIGVITEPRDRYKTFATWFRFFREIPTVCPENAI